MPTKARRQREKLERERLAELDQALRDPPDHIKKAKATEGTRLNDLILASIDEFQSASANAPYRLRGGLLVAVEEGQLGINRKAMSNGAKRINEQRIAGNKAIGKRSKYLAVWGKKSAAKSIAISEGVALSTVYRWFKQAP